MSSHEARRSRLRATAGALHLDTSTAIAALYSARRQKAMGRGYAMAVDALQRCRSGRSFARCSTRVVDVGVGGVPN
eukprot:696228-Prymnesium_polylepis.1